MKKKEQYVTPLTMEMLLTSVLQQMADETEQGKRIGATTHYDDLDNMTCGLLRPGELIVIAGRPGVGKTSFMINIAQNTSFIDKIPVLFFCFEHTAAHLARRMIACRGRIDTCRIFSGEDLNSADAVKLYRSVAHLSEMSIYVKDTETNILSIIETSKDLKKKNKKISVIIIDSLQSVQSNGVDRAQQVANICRELKLLAMELGVSVVLSAQVGRSVETRDDHRPRLSDLSDSAAIENMADTVLLLYRDEMYNKSETNKWRSVVEMEIAKQRNGPTGMIRFYFLEKYLSFEKYRDIEGWEPMP